LGGQAFANVPKLCDHGVIIGPVFCEIIVLSDINEGLSFREGILVAARKRVARLGRGEGREHWDVDNNVISSDSTNVSEGGF